MRHAHRRNAKKARRYTRKHAGFWMTVKHYIDFLAG